MWRRFKGQSQSSERGASGDAENPEGEKVSSIKELNHDETISENKHGLSDNSKSPKDNSKKGRRDLNMDNSIHTTSKSNDTSTSKKSFWRARMNSSPVLKQSEDHNTSKKLSKKPNKKSSATSGKSHTSSFSQNSNQVSRETAMGDVSGKKLKHQTPNINSKTSQGASHYSNRKNSNQPDAISVLPTLNHPFEAAFLPEEVGQRINQRFRGGSYHTDQAMLSRQYSTPVHNNQNSSFTTSRSISTPMDPSIALQIAESASNTRPRNSISNSNKRTGRVSSRFSLRRLFYGNNVAQPAILRSLGPRASIEMATNAKVTNPSNRFVEDNQSDTKSTVWRDNTSSCSSLQGGAAAAISIGGHSTAASLMAVAGGSTSSTVLRECPLCLSECTLDLFPLLRNCHHLFCIDCLQTYVKIEIQEGRVNLRCPQCTELMHPNDIETLIGDKNSNLLTLYESLMLRRLLAVDPDTRWCPGPNCTYAVIAAGCASCPKITCERPGCGYAFCYHCKAEWHPNQTCDAARAQRSQQQTAMIGANIPMALRSSSGTFSIEAINAAGGANAAGVINGSMGVPSNNGQASEVKVCPRCNTLIVKMDDGSCNHMTCPVCGAEFCWLCMKEISDLHYLSPSGCTFWGKKPWSRKKKLLWQLGTLVGAPVGIALLAGIAVPAMIIGIPSWVGRKIHDHYKQKNKHRRNLAVVGGVISSLIISPFLAGLAVSIGVPILLCYVYGVVPIALCRSEGCGVYTTVSGVRIDIDEDDIDMANAASQLANAVMTAGENAAASFRNMKSGNPAAIQTSFSDTRNDNTSIANRKSLNVGSSRGHHRNPDLVTNPSIGEVSLGASLSLGSGCHLNEREQDTDLASRECDRESASNTAVAGASLTGSLASSYFGVRNHENNVSNCQRPDETQKSANNQSAATMNGIGNYHLQNRLEVDVHNGQRKKFSFSSERLSETISLSERSATISLADGDGARSEASTKALAGSILAYKLDSQSVGSYHRVIGERSTGDPTSETTSNVVPPSSASMGYGGTVSVGMHEDALSLRSLPLHPASTQGRSNGGDMYQTSVKEHHLQNPSSSIVSVVPPRSLSPVSSMSGDELSYVPTAMSQLHGNNTLIAGISASNMHPQGGSKRFSRRPRAMLDKQLSENSSLLGEADTISERVRFDDNVSFIDADSDYMTNENINANFETMASEDARNADISCKFTNDDVMIKSSECGYDNATVIADDLTPCQRPIKGSTMIDTTCTVTEETAEELAQVVSPPIIRTQTRSTEPVDTRRKRDPTVEGISEQSEIYSGKKITLTSTGSSIVKLNQPNCISDIRVLPITERGDSLSYSPTVTHEDCISQSESSFRDSHKNDHVTLLTVGDNTDPQVQTDHS